MKLADNNVLVLCAFCLWSRSHIGHWFLFFL